MKYSKHIIFILCFVCSSCTTIQPEDVKISAPEWSDATPESTLNQTGASENTTALASPTTNPAEPSTRVSFQGKVLKGEIFEEALSDSLLFRLDPLKHGWEIWVGDNMAAEHNFSAVATPPFHGINARYIEGWHFRNSDNSGPNEAGEKNVNAPQYQREFCFFLNDSDYQMAYAWLNDQQSSEGDRQESAENYSLERARAGTLKINHLELDNLVVDEQAWIESMEFEVELRLSEECPLY